MSLHIGDTAPDFTADTTKGEISFHKWAADSWVFFFSHPADFTPVCTTEMGKTARLAQQFAARNTKPLGLSTDTVPEHLKWIEDVATIPACPKSANSCRRTILSHSGNAMWPSTSAVSTG